jgi:outer membrane lipoprotein LolB
LTRRLLLATALLLLAGCATAPPTSDVADPRYAQRAAALADVPEWSLRGRLAVRNGDDGGSGTLRWRQADDAAQMDFHGALGRGAWRLVARPADAELVLADGRSFRAANVNALVAGELGWNVPVDDLAWWVRGLEAPGGAEDRRYDADGRIVSMSQSGWAIEYGRYREVSGIAMPLKMTARSGERYVKLAVRDWTLGADAP